MSSSSAGVIRFAAPWNRDLVISTVLVSALIVGAAGAVAFAYRDRPWLATSTASLLLASLVLAWALAPRSFATDGQRLVVERPLRRVTLAFSDIRSARAVDATEAQRLGLTGALRTFGTSGLFGHYGRFRSAALGSFRMYATRTSGFVVLDTTRGFVVLTPDEPHELCARIVGRPA
jgi:hypothetical protein